MFFNSSLEQRCDDNSRDLSFARFFDKSQSFTNDLPVTVVFELKRDEATKCLARDALPVLDLPWNK